MKRDLSSLPPILKTLVAFANSAGGTLVIGIQDDGAVVGIGDALRDEERLASSIADGICPAMTPEMDLASHEGKTLLLVRVPHWRGPFCLRSEGPQEGVCIRLGSTNRRAGPELLAELQHALSGLSFDQLPCVDLTPDDLDPERIRRYFAAIGRRISQEHLESLGVLVAQADRLAPSHGGLILFGRDAPRQPIDANRLEVENPGMLPFGMTLDDLKAGVSRIRNRVIVRVLREPGLVEEWGTGYRRVTQACEEGGYPPPAWQELGAALGVVFLPHPEAADADSRLNNASVAEAANEARLEQSILAQAFRGVL